jgi:hypothetical protein
LRLPWQSKPTKVYVDAKILNMHDPSLQKEAYVGYVVEGSTAKGGKSVKAAETDDAEVLAIMFAIDELKHKLPRFVVVCDHESVVSEANRDVVKKPSELMAKLREMLTENPSITLEVLKANPAHGVVTEYVNSLKTAME